MGDDATVAPAAEAVGVVESQTQLQTPLASLEVDGGSGTVGLLSVPSSTVSVTLDEQPLALQTTSSIVNQLPEAQKTVVQERFKILDQQVTQQSSSAFKEFVELQKHVIALEAQGTVPLETYQAALVQVQAYQKQLSGSRIAEEQQVMNQQTAQWQAVEMIQQIRLRLKRRWRPRMGCNRT